MLFQKRFWDGIRDGSITLTFRQWKTPRVIAGRVYRSTAGRLEVETVEIVEIDSITERDACVAGHASADALRNDMPGEAGNPVYRIGFRYLNEPDPRDVLARTSVLPPEAIEQIGSRLRRLDVASKRGPWTSAVLQLIRENPRLRAPDLAAMRGLDTAVFKTDVRKLKNLGLTLSFNPGYEISPRGEAYLAMIGDAD